MKEQAASTQLFRCENQKNSFQTNNSTFYLSKMLFLHLIKYK